MMRTEKTVFLSYRRTDIGLALAIYSALTHRGFDVFFDYQGLGSGAFETAISENIKARAHFLALLTPNALVPREVEVDWFRREIEVALDSKRNIVPLLAEGFDFGKPEVRAALRGTLDRLSMYNGPRLSEEYFDAFMDKLSEKFLNVALDMVLHPPSAKARAVVKKQKTAADAALPRLASHDGVESYTVANAGVILLPAEQSEVLQRTAVSGRTDSLDPDVQPWLIVEIANGTLYPQTPVTRRLGIWSHDVRIGRVQRGLDVGTEFVILLAVVGQETNYQYSRYIRNQHESKDGMGSFWPEDLAVLDKRRVLRGPY